MNKGLYISSAGATVSVSGTEEKIDTIENSSFLEAYVPAYSSPANLGAADCTINLKEGSQQGLVIDYPNAIYSYVDVDFEPREIIALAEFLLERARQEKNILCIHGACAIVDGKAVISSGGASGIGKSTIAYELSKVGGTFYADEKILIDLDSCRVVGGIKSAYVSSQYWRDKLGEDEYFPITDEKESIEGYPIAAFIYPCLVDHNVPVLSERLDTSKFEWHLWEESCRKIRGGSRRFFNYTMPAQSLDTPELSLKRLAGVKKIVQTIPSYYMNGGKRQIIEKVLLFLE